MISLRSRWTVAVAVCSATFAAGDPPRPLPRALPVASAPVRKPSVLEVVAANYREQVGQVLKAPTLAAKATDETFVAHPKVYDFLIEHPDRTALAWQRMKVPCVDITDLGKGQFYWSDGEGSELAWQAVGRFEHGIVWYATGKVKAGTLMPSVPVRAVAVLHAPRVMDKDRGEATFKPSIHVYMLSDSRLATAALRVMGSNAPKLAEQGAEQLLFFFSGVARYLQDHPEKVGAALAPKQK